IFRIFVPIVLLIFALPLHGSSTALLVLKEKYEKACRETTDINEHVPVLRCLASQCSSVVEIGMRGMVSTWGILQGLSESSSAAPKYLGIDIETPPGIRSAKYLAEACGISFEFLKGNDMTLDIEPTEMLFIDSLHTYCHLLFELKKFSPKVSKYIAIHDTNAPWGFAEDHFYKGDYTEYPAEYDRSKRGLWAAVEDFLIQHPEWVITEHHFHNYGFTILKRKSTPPK
ncbi:MAG TPA: hypothetical protein VMR37_05020, partial [Rhabdochlamydiaceae bacterium]|nr:hypothetical protein [Rhabdochlamydiaceae bacterium]